MKRGQPCVDLVALPVPTLERGNDEVVRNLTVLIDLMIADDRSHAPAWERRPRRSRVPMR